MILRTSRVTITEVVFMLGPAQRVSSLCASILAFHSSSSPCPGRVDIPVPTSAFPLLCWEYFSS